MAQRKTRRFSDRYGRYFIAMERHNCSAQEALELGLKLASAPPVNHHLWSLRVQRSDRGTRHQVEVWYRLTE